MTQQQNIIFANKMNAYLDNQTMSWDNETRAWHKIALKALSFSSPTALQIEASAFHLLTKTDNYGIGMNAVMILASNMERVSPNQMGYTVEVWGEILLTNNKILDRWHKMVEPTRKKVMKEMEIMGQSTGIIAKV